MKNMPALHTGSPEPIALIPPLSTMTPRRHGALRWLTLGAISVGCAVTLRSDALWPELPIFLAVIGAYVALVQWQYHDRTVYGGELRLDSRLYLALSALMVFAIVVAGGPVTRNGDSLWYCIMYFIVLSEGRHVSSSRMLAAVCVLCMALTHLAVLIVLPMHDWSMASLSFLPLDAGLIASAFGARLQRRQEEEHATRLTLLEELAESKERLEEANRQLQVYAGTVEQLAVANERNRLARDLHDILGYTLATVVVKAEAAKRLLASDPARVQDELARLQDVARDGLAEVRRSVAGLRDASAAVSIWHEALTRFVNVFARENGLQITCSIGCLPEEHDPALEMCLFRVIQESLTNVTRHAQATQVQVDLRVEDGQIMLSIEDDGVGTGPTDAATAGYGLRGMRERVEQLGGRLVFTSRRGQGARVMATVPLAERAETPVPAAEATLVAAERAHEGIQLHGRGQIGVSGDNGGSRRESGR